MSRLNTLMIKGTGRVLPPIMDQSIPISVTLSNAACTIAAKVMVTYHDIDVGILHLVEVLHV